MAFRPETANLEESMSGDRGSKDILAEENKDDREKLVKMLEKAYWMEIETVMSYVTNSTNPDGVRAMEIKESLQTDIPHVIRGVIEAESGAIAFYNEIIEFAGDVDPVTEDMVITILRDEQGHMREFEGFLREYEAEGKA